MRYFAKNFLNQRLVIKTMYNNKNRIIKDKVFNKNKNYKIVKKSWIPGDEVKEKNTWRAK
jgi:hypothetical protein